MEMSEEELQAIYQWIDEIPLSRPKRHIARDFSDGVLVAEVVAHYYPKLVELHNYSMANGVAQKLYNWNTLNAKVLQKLHFHIEREDVDSVCNCVPGSIERVLKQLKLKIAKHRLGGPGSRRSTPPGSAGQELSSQNPQIQRLDGAYTSPEKAAKASSSGIVAGGGSLGPTRGGFGTSPGVNSGGAGEVSAVKDATILELRETNELLETKVKKLEQLVRLKESKIQALTAKLQQAGLA